MKEDKHGQRKTSQEHRCQNGQLESDSRGLGVIKTTGSEIGDDTFGASGVVRSREGGIQSIDNARNSDTGGILRQLIDEHREEINIKLAEVERLRTRVDHFQDLLENLDQRIEENS